MTKRTGGLKQKPRVVPRSQHNGLKERLPSKACQSAIIQHLSRIEEVDAIFSQLDDKGILHIYSVVEEHRPEIYKKVMKAEEHIERQLPDMHFHFCVRARQGRQPSLAVPVSSQPIFAR